MPVALHLFVAEFETYLPAVEDLPRRQLALAILALMYGGLTLARALRGSALSDDVIRAFGRMAIRVTKRVPS